jgi:TM2 domain-containing membrane protein YozV
MNCANHPEAIATAFCRECGKPMCRECQRPALGSIYCEEHRPATAPPPIPDPAAASAGYTGSPYAAPPPPPGYTAPPPFPRESLPYTSPYTAADSQAAPDPGAHPVLALILGFLPGVGAIYNGQYAKGLIHAVIFGLLISIVSNSQSGSVAAFVGIMIAAWVIYQAFEAYHTARKRRYGVAVEEFSSLFEIRPAHGRFPVGAIVLIAIGFLLLLDTTDIISMEQFERYWPAGLIVVGLYMLYARMNPGDHGSGSVNGPVNGEARR